MYNIATILKLDHKIIILSCSRHINIRVRTNYGTKSKFKVLSKIGVFCLFVYVDFILECINNMETYSICHIS